MSAPVNCDDLDALPEDPTLLGYPVNAGSDVTLEERLHWFNCHSLEGRRTSDVPDRDLGLGVGSRYMACAVTHARARARNGQAALCLFAMLCSLTVWLLGTYAFIAVCVICAVAILMLFGEYRSEMKNLAITANSVDDVWGEFCRREEAAFNGERQ